MKGSVMHTYHAQCRWGDFLLLKGDMVSQFMRIYGEWEYCTFETLGSLLRPGDQVVEVGSHLGTLTVPMAQIVGSEGHVIAIEPQRVLSQILSANVVMNDLTNVTVKNLAAGKKVERLTIEDCDYSEAWNYSAFSLRNGFSQERAFNRSLTTATVEVIPLDQIPEVQNLDGLRVLKVDVEGMELEVLAGSKQTIQRHCPILFIENQCEAEEGDSVIQAIWDMGYTPYWHIARRVHGDNYHQVAIGFDDLDMNMLCLPPNSGIDAEKYQKAMPGDCANRAAIQLVA